MSGCPHLDALRVAGSCYLCIKRRALNGSRSKLSPEALAFAGFLPEGPPERGWKPALMLLVAGDDEDHAIHKPREESDG